MRSFTIPLVLALASTLALAACGGGGKKSSGSLPDNGLIAFMVQEGEDWDVHVMNADGSGKHRLLADLGLEGLPDWSPDGTMLTFVRQRNEKTDAYVARADGTHEQRLTTDGISNWPLWAPDGKSVAVRRNDEARSLYVVASDGSSSRKVAAGLWPDAGVAWSPDSSRIAIVVGEPEGSGVIQVIDVESGDKTSLEQTDSTVTWAPDGKRIAFASSGVIYVMDPEGNGKVKIAGQLGPDAEPISSPAWSPDGKHIVYERGASMSDPFGSGDVITTMSILLVDPDGTHGQVLVKETGFEFPPIWAPDGSQVLFQKDASSETAQNLDICLSGVAQRGNTCITPGNSIQVAAAWQPVRS